MTGRRNQIETNRAGLEELPPIKFIVPRLERVTIHNKLDAFKN